jgi:hypothetical protein
LRPVQISTFPQGRRQIHASWAGGDGQRAHCAGHLARGQAQQQARYGRSPARRRVSGFALAATLPARPVSTRSSVSAVALESCRRRAKANCRDLMELRRLPNLWMGRCRLTTVRRGLPGQAGLGASPRQTGPFYCRLLEGAIYTVKPICDWTSGNVPGILPAQVG